MWLRRHFVAFVIFFAALVTIADGSLPRTETHRIEEPCGITLIGACLPRKVVVWERTQGAVVEATQGFTLLELAIVLTVIGLIVGGILWGADMIGAAATRAQISQLETFNAAANTFVTKYGYLPGDIPAAAVTQFGFSVIPTRAGTQGQGDGNGLLEGIYSGGVNSALQSGETAWFWADLSANAGFIKADCTGANPTPTVATHGYDLSGAWTISTLLPPAQIGNGNYVYVVSQNPVNYFGLSIITSVDGNGAIQGGAPGLTVAQAYNIDKKIDDGLPQTGRITARYDNWPLGGFVWAAGGGVVGASPGGTATGTTTSCYDNGGSVTGATMQYSMEISNGSNVNCALSFQMQGAAR